MRSESVNAGGCGKEVLILAEELKKNMKRFYTEGGTGGQADMPLVQEGEEQEFADALREMESLAVENFGHGHQFRLRALENQISGNS